MNPDMIECGTCGQWFNNTDGTEVCPNGHEPQGDSDDDCTCPEQSWWRRVNWYRAVGRFMIALAVWYVCLGIYHLGGGQYVWAAQAFGWAWLNVVAWLWCRSFYAARKDPLTVRVYQHGRLVSSMRFDDDGLAWSGGVIIEPTIVERRDDTR